MTGDVTNSVTGVGGGGAALCKMTTEHGHVSKLAFINLPIMHLYLMGINVIGGGNNFSGLLAEIPV